jgi:hypoxanthine phosphoribosyltransferase
MTDNQWVAQVPRGCPAGADPFELASAVTPAENRGMPSGNLRPLIDAPTLAARVASLGTTIADTIPEGNLVVVGVLRGAFIFMADLVRALPREHHCDFLAVRSYGDATETSGVVEITSDLSSPIEGKHVLLVEDIVDTGLTLKYLVNLLEARKPRSLRVAALLSKPSRRRVEVAIDFVGFEVEDRFVVGYGLDAAQKYRHLPYVAELLPDDDVAR